MFNPNPGIDLFGPGTQPMQPQAQAPLMMDLLSGPTGPSPGQTGLGDLFNPVQQMQ